MSNVLELKKIAVFCGSSMGSNPIHKQAARALGEEMVRRRIGLVYGGGNVGLMGVIAETCAQLGEDSVMGVIPKNLAPREISGTTIGNIHVVDDMHSRKALMFREADGFITIPGGFGTLDETMEITTWQQLGLHSKPVGILNIDGYFDHLLKFFDQAVEEGFIRQSSRDIIISDTDPASLLDKMQDFRPSPSVVELAANGLLPDDQRG